MHHAFEKELAFCVNLRGRQIKLTDRSVLSFSFLMEFDKLIVKKENTDLDKDPESRPPNGSGV